MNLKFTDIDGKVEDIFEVESKEYAMQIVKESIGSIECYVGGITLEENGKVYTLDYAWK